jgi:hypothetical protein
MPRLFRKRAAGSGHIGRRPSDCSRAPLHETGAGPAIRARAHDLARLAFQPANLARLPLGTKIAMARVLGLGPLGYPARLGRALATLSLSAQGLLPGRAHAPLLSNNGDLDELVPIAELSYLSDQGVAHDRLQFADDRHVASRNWRLHEAFAADWLVPPRLVRDVGRRNSAGLKANAVSAPRPTPSSPVR